MVDNYALMLQENADLIRAIENLELQKKEIEKQESAMRDELLKAMEEHGVLGFSVGRLDVTYIAETTRDSIDTKALKKDLPDVAELYTRTSKVKASVRLNVIKEKKEEVA